MELKEPKYTTPEAEDILGYSRGTLTKLRYRRQGPRFLKIGKLVRYPESALREFLEAHTIHPESAGAGATE